MFNLSWMNELCTLGKIYGIVFEDKDSCISIDQLDLPLFPYNLFAFTETRVASDLSFLNLYTQLLELARSIAPSIIKTSTETLNIQRYLIKQLGHEDNLIIAQSLYAVILINDRDIGAKLFNKENAINCWKLVEVLFKSNNQIVIKLLGSMLQHDILKNAIEWLNLFNVGCTLILF